MAVVDMRRATERPSADAAGVPLPRENRIELVHGEAIDPADAPTPLRRIGMIAGTLSGVDLIAVRKSPGSAVRDLSLPVFGILGIAFSLTFGSGHGSGLQMLRWTRKPARHRGEIATADGPVQVGLEWTEGGAAGIGREERLTLRRSGGIRPRGETRSHPSAVLDDA
jgi:hypothetical protein